MTKRSKKRHNKSKSIRASKKSSNQASKIKSSSTAKKVLTVGSKKSKKSCKPFVKTGFSIIGHRTCVPNDPLVPRNMGWLWTAKNVPGIKFDPYWRPGAVDKRFFKKVVFTSKNRSINKNPTTDVVARRSQHKRSKSRMHLSSSDYKPGTSSLLEPALVVKKANKDFLITLQPMKDLSSRQASDYPYTGSLPFSCRIENMSETETEKCSNKSKAKEVQDKRKICQRAFDNICNEVFQNVDQKQLQELATENNECPCFYLQNEVIQLLIDSYLTNNETIEESKRSLEDNEDLQEDIINYLIDTYLHDGSSCSSEDLRESSSSSSDRSWSVRYTPVCAKYNSAEIPERSHVEMLDQATQIVDLINETGIKVIRPSIKFRK